MGAGVETGQPPQWAGAPGPGAQHLAAVGLSRVQESLSDLFYFIVLLSRKQLKGTTGVGVWALLLEA